MPRRVFITVAEVSGDQHAALLIRHLKARDPSILIEGHGGPLMRASGATIHFETTGNAAMGVHGAGRAGEILKILRWTRAHFRNNRPSLHIGVDSPDSNIHFAKLAKSLGVPVLQFVAPQLWAWREGRIRKVRRRIDRIACILPFEQEYFTSRGVDARFVGHPLFDEPHLAPAALRQARATTSPVVGLLPGSRKSEALANFSPMLEVAREIRRALAGATFLVPTTPATHPVCTELAAGFGGVEIALGGFDDMAPRCDLCITASGTATLHVALHNTPLIAVYRFNKWLVKLQRFLMKTRTFALVNLLAAGGVDRPGAPEPREHIVPEFIPWTGPVDPVARCALDLLRNPQKLQRQHDALHALIQRVGQPGASQRAAEMALSMLK